VASHTTSDEVVRKYVEQMGEELGTLFAELWGEVATLHVKWAQFVELFGTSPSRIEVLNEAAPFFFRVLQDTLFEDTLLHIARLTDPVKSAGKRNLTIRRLPGLMEDSSSRDEVEELVEGAVGAAAFCRDWRNRLLAHRDFDLIFDKHAKTLEVASRAQVKEALSHLATALNGVEKCTNGSPTIFEGPVLGGADQLLYYLKIGIEAELERIGRMGAGEIRPEDLRTREI